MTVQTLIPSFPNFVGADGKPLTAGSVYFGQPSQDPRTSPKAVFYDAALTLPVVQPVSTQAGYLYRNGTPTRIYADGACSVLVLDAAGAQVYYDPEWFGTAASFAALLSATTAGTSTAYTLAPSPSIPNYAAGQSFFVTFHAASGAAPTLAISGIAAPPNLVKQEPDGTYANVAANDIPANHRSRVTLLSATQAWVETLPRHTIASSATTSLSSALVDITGIPAWAKEVIVNIDGMSTNGTSIPIIQIGDSGGVETAGYVGSGVNLANATSPSAAAVSNGFSLGAAVALPSTLHGSFVLRLQDSATNRWVATSLLAFSDSSGIALGGGAKSLSATLDRIRVTTTGGADTFDSGSVSIIYKG